METLEQLRQRRERQERKKILYKQSKAIVSAYQRARKTK